MKLYFSPGACSVAPHIALEYAGLPYEAIQVDLKSKIIKATHANFYLINPKGQVPTLQLADGKVLTEAAVVLQYIADHAPHKNLLPAAGTFARYQTLEWVNFVATEFHKGFSPLFSDALSPEAKSIFRDKLKTKLSFLDKHFWSASYLAGETLSIADFYLYTTLRWAKSRQIELVDYPNVQKYFFGLADLPAVQTVQKNEGIA